LLQPFQATGGLLPHLPDPGFGTLSQFGVILVLPAPGGFSKSLHLIVTADLALE
jgi:hypothetical protein